MKRAVVNPEKCKNCNPCALQNGCPQDAVIRESVFDKPWIDFYNCRGCMKCKGLCFYNAVEEITHPCDGKARKGW